jgi:hypothetical protein
MIRNLFNSVWDRWANLHPFVRFLTVAVVMGAAGMVVVRPAYRAFKSWRLERNLVAARVAVDEVRMDAARDLSLTVLRAGDPRIEAFRILEESMDSLRDPRHAEIARALISHPEGSDADRLAGFRGMVTEVPLGLLGQAWSSLPKSCQANPEFAILFADRLISGNRFSEAASVLLGVPDAARTVGVEQALIRVLIRSGKRDGYDEAQRRLAAQWPATGEGLDGWLDLLEEIPPVSLRPESLVKVKSALENPGVADPARAALALARIEYAANYAMRAELLGRTVSRWKDEAPETLAEFLHDLGLHGLLLETFPASRVREQPRLFPRVLDAMQRSGAWDQVGPLLEEHGPGLPETEWLAQRALLAMKTGDSAGLVRDWGEAIGEARSGVTGNPFLPLYQFAREAGMETEASQAMLEAIRYGRGPLPLYEDLKFLLNQLAGQGRENTLLEIGAIYMSFEPGNPALLTQYAYLACLNNLAAPKDILKAVEPLAKAFPKQLPVQCVLATVYLSDNQPAKAAEILDPFKLDAAALSPGYRATFLGTQLLNRRISKNDPQIDGFPTKSLLPSERRKLNEWIARSEL